MTPWKVLKRRWLLRRPWISVRVEQVRTGSGVVLDDYPLITTRDWVCIVCLSDADEFVLARQYRHGVGRETLEFPAGGIDEDEAPLVAAQRELREETGYEATDWTFLKAVHPETTRHAHKAHLFLARGARRVTAQSLDPGEEVLVCMRKVGEAKQLADELSHGIHTLALLLALAEIESPGAEDCSHLGPSGSSGAGLGQG